jgi:hypothetical protein
MTRLALSLLAITFFACFIMSGKLSMISFVISHSSLIDIKETDRDHHAVRSPSWQTNLNARLHSATGTTSTTAFRMDTNSLWGYTFSAQPTLKGEMDTDMDIFLMPMAMSWQTFRSHTFLPPTHRCGHLHSTPTCPTARMCMISLLS